MTRKEELLTLALSLAITAPTDEKANDYSELSEHLAVALNAEQVEACKTEALRIAERLPNV